jgi:hypothetical protein
MIPADDALLTLKDAREALKAKSGQQIIDARLKKWPRSSTCRGRQLLSPGSGSSQGRFSIWRVTLALLRHLLRAKEVVLWAHRAVRAALA